MLYTGDKLTEIVFPLGGIGTGCIGLTGSGQLRDFEIFNRPNKGSTNGHTHIAVRAVKNGKCIARVLNGDFRSCRTGQFKNRIWANGFGFGVESATMSGFPHFAKTEFRGEFPYAFIDFDEGGFPAKMSLRAFNPLIPLDDFNSSLPAAYLDVGFENTDSEEITYAAALSFLNPYGGKGINRTAELKHGRGVTLASTSNDPIEYTDGSITIAVEDENAFVQNCWYRGAWQDHIATFWNEFSSGGALRARSYDTPGSDHATVLSEFTLKPGEKKTVRFVISWYHPFCYNYWNPYKDETGKDVTWKNWYATVFTGSEDVCAYALENRGELDRRTMAFHDALFSSTLDPAVLDAVSSTMSVLKTATVLRLEDGSFYGFEGVHEHEGCCEGTCQHVWNYAYALPFLFPRLERSIRDLEFKYSTDERGDMEFRLKLPVGRPFSRFRPCVDGQMGTVIKTYREWKISGDSEWLKQVYPTVVKALDFAFSPENRDEWDKNQDGVLEGRQHHTLDMELFGPSSWLEGFYLGALCAGSRMAAEMGDTDRARRYEELYEKGRAWTKENLFNGRYFIQKTDLEDKSVCEHFDCMNYWNEETGEIKYQIGEGSSIDQLCAQWHADIVGLGKLFDKDQIDTALKNMMEINYMPSMRSFANPWRLFCINDEAGTLICGYPDGARKPKIPVPYCEETMHGFEYQFAGLLAAEGRYEDSLKVVRAVRDRYDGRWRNPYNEIECGSNYARSMASFALLPITSGFTFDLPHGEIGFDPILPGDFNCLWSLGTGWGNYHKGDKESVISLIEGELKLSRISLPYLADVKRVKADGKEVPFTFENGVIALKETTVKHEIRFE